jgi:hypothetical protein
MDFTFFTTDNKSGYKTTEKFIGYMIVEILDGNILINLYKKYTCPII